MLNTRRPLQADRFTYLHSVDRWTEPDKCSRSQLRSRDTRPRCDMGWGDMVTTLPQLQGLQLEDCRRHLGNEANAQREWKRDTTYPAVYRPAQSTEIKCDDTPVLVERVERKGWPTFGALRLVYTYDASTSISTSTSISHVWTGTTQAQAQARVPFSCACACVVPVHTWLMLVLASYV